MKFPRGPAPSFREANSGSFARSAGRVGASARELPRHNGPEAREEDRGLESPLNVFPREKPKAGARRVGLKYCGGCNPRYDRIALVEDLKARLGREIEWAPLAVGDLDFVLAIEGCETACADLSPFGGTEIRIITCPKAAQGFILEMERRVTGTGQG